MPIDAEIAPPIDTVVRQPKPWWIFVLRLTVVLVVAVALGLAIERAVAHWKLQSRENQLQLTDLDYRWLLASAGFYAVGLLPATMVLSRAVRSLGANPSLRSVMAAQLIGHLGKYVPGKAMVIVLRAAILNRSGAKVSIRAATIAITIETLTVIATGAMLALMVLVFVDSPVWKTPSWMKEMSLLMAIGSVVATWPSLLRLVVSRRIVGGALSFNWSWQDMIAAWLWNGLGWLLLGASMTAVVFAMPENIRSQHVFSVIDMYPLCLASIAFAFVAGFLSLLPGGAGVRELVITTLLSPVAGISGAMVAAITLRGIHLAVEILMAGFAWLILIQVGDSSSDVDGASDHD